MGANDKAEATFHPRREITWSIEIGSNAGLWRETEAKWHQEMDRLAESIIDAEDRFLTFMESMPGFWRCLYHATDFFWRSEGWHLLWWRIRTPKRKVRKMRTKFEDDQHARWASNLLEGKKYGTHTTSHRAEVHRLPYLPARVETE